MRFILRIPIHVLKAAALLAVAAVLVFFGLTRTQVGRDGLKGQIEGAFADQFQGTIEIGKLTGNLVYDLYATDVRLRDPQGRVVLEADSVVIEPTWRGLLQRRIVIDEAILFQPRVAFVRSADGRWNLAETFAPNRPRTDPARPLSFDAPDLRIVGGTISTRNDGLLPDAVQRGTLFDYTNATVTDLDTRLRFVWEGERRRITVRQLSARAIDPRLAIDRLSGTLDLSDGLRLHLAHLETGSSRIAGRFARTRPSADAEPHVALHLEPSRVSGDELRRILPFLPVADAVDVSADVEGPLRDLTVESLTLARGATDIRAEGRLALRSGETEFAVQIPRATVRQSDIEAVLPGVDIPALRRLGMATIRLDADGSIADGGFSTQASFAARTDAGRAEGTVELDRRSNRPLAYDLDADLAAFDPGLVLGDPMYNGSITGRVAVDGQGVDARSLDADVRLALTESRFAGRSFEALDADVTADGLRFDGTATLVADGTLQLAGTADLAADVPDFDLDAIADRFDLRRLVDGAPATRLTADMTLVGTGSSFGDFDGDLAVRFDPSTLTLGGTARPIPAHATTLRLRPGGSPRLDLDSDLLSVRADGDIDPAALAALGMQWAEAVARTVHIERGKFYRTPADSLRPVVAPVRAPTTAAPQRLDLDVTVRRPRALQALVPGFPRLAEGTTLDMAARIAPDSLVLDAFVGGDSLRAPGVASGGFDAVLSLRSGYGRTLVGRSTLDLTLGADTLRVPVGTLHGAAASVTLRGREADIVVRSERIGDAGQFNFEAGLDAGPDRNRLTIRTLDAVIGDQLWAATGQPRIDLYADAIVLDALVLERQEDEEIPPRLALRGVLSPADTDSLYVDAVALDLDEVFTIIGLRNFFGGQLDAQFAVASVLRQPTVIGAATVEQFTFAGRRAGQIEITSQFVPGGDGVAVDLRLRPDGDSLSVVNDFRAVGTVRLPGTADDGTRDRGALDLDLDIDRLDLFVFDWLFPSIIDDAEGYVAGSGRITGVPRVPLFDAALTVNDGRFRVPDFGLALQAEGRLTVDREGCHISTIQLADKSGGQGLVRGDVLFNDYRFFSFDLEADLAEIEIVDVPDSRDLPFYGYIRATGSATLTGPIDNVFLRAPDAQTTPDSEMFIPITASGPGGDAGFLVFADSLGNVPESATRRSLISRRPEGERAFLEGLEMNLGVLAPSGSTVHLVFDPSIGDVITAVGSARLQLGIREGEFFTYGTFDVARGDYLFTAGDVFTRRFELEEGGTLRWDGDPINASLNLPATYETRASLAGLDLPNVDPRQRVPIIITLDVSGRVLSPLVGLSIALDESNRTVAGGEALRRRLNQEDRQAEYATSVLLTNSFLLAPSENPALLGEAADELFFTSLSQLVSSRLNLFLNDALGSENVDVLFGVQQGANADHFDVTYGVALRLLDERLIIRGEGIYQRLQDRPVSEELQGEVAVEVRLSPSVSLEVFYRREGDVLLGSGLSATPYGAYGAGVNYETDFASWNALLRRIIGEAAEEREEAAVAAPF